MLYEIIPNTKPRQTRSDKWKQRPCVMQYRAFKDECRLKQVHIPEACSITFYMPMPESWSKKKKVEMLGKPHQQTPDLDNLCKGLCDILEDDAHIWKISAEKVWAVNGAIEIVELKSPGV